VCIETDSIHIGKENKLLFLLELLRCNNIISVIKHNYFSIKTMNTLKLILNFDLDAK